MSTPTYTVNTTTATEFSYTLSNLTAQITALTLTGFGTGFTYDANQDVNGGFLQDAEASVTFSFLVPDVGLVSDTFTYHLFLELDEDVSTMLADPDFDGQLREQLELEAADFEEVDVSELLQLFTFDASGQILTAPNPVITYFNDTGPKLGTSIRDEIMFNDTDGRIDTLAGDDIVFMEADSGHVRATLRSGDDVFVGATFGGFGPLDPSAPTTWVNGGAGNDILFGGRGADQLRGFNDNDLLVGLEGEDRLTGGGGNDEIYGGRHDDVIFAGSGRDIVDGGLGDDVATGGLGKDVFVFDIFLNQDFFGGVTTEHDIVQDFAVGLDTLHFRNGTTDLDRAAAFQIFDANSVQVGDDTVFSYLDGTITLRNTNKADFSFNSFFDKPWQIDSEFDLFDRLDAVL